MITGRTVLIAIEMLAASVWVGSLVFLALVSTSLPSARRPVARRSVSRYRTHIWPGRYRSTSRRDRRRGGDRGTTIALGDDGPLRSSCLWCSSHSPSPAWRKHAG